MNWAEEYLRLSREMKALMDKLEACAAQNAELLAALEDVANDPALSATSYLKARAAIDKATGGNKYG